MGILQMSLSAGGLVIVVVLIRSVALNRLPKKMFLVLWGVALFRLLVPISIPLPFSVPSIIGEVSNVVLPDTAVILPVAESPVYTEDLPTGITEIPGASEVIMDAVQTKMPTIAPTTILWLAGMFAAFIFFAVIHYRNHKRLRFATTVRDNDFLNEWLAEHKHIRPVEIMQLDRIISPLAVGIFKPRIILPMTMDMNDKQLMNYVLTHEYHHIKRYDALWKILLAVALCVHWFNPLVWLMFVLASRDLELTCDEAVIRRFGAKTKKDYAYMLIGMVEQRSKFAPLYNGFSKNATHERIESIMKNKKLTLASVILAVVLVSVLTVGVLAASSANAQTNEKNPAYVPPISWDNLGGERIDYVDALADDFLIIEMKEVEALFISEVLLEYRDDLNGLTIISDFYRDSIYGDIWLVSATNKDRTETYTAVIESGAMNILELYRHDVGSYLTMEESIALGQRHDGNDASEIQLPDDNLALVPRHDGNDASAVYEIIEEQKPLPRQEERIETNVNTSNDVLMSFGLISVSRNDEKRFTADEWAGILEKIEKGEMQWED